MAGLTDKKISDVVQYNNGQRPSFIFIFIRSSWLYDLPAARKVQ